MLVEPIDFYLRDWVAWDGEFKGKKLELTPPLPLRRRISPLGQKALEAAYNLAPSGQFSIVFSSRHGEYSRTISMFNSLAREGSVSPSDFSLSVHHGLISLLSIAQGNRAGHTAIASGDESFCYGLLEALVLLKEKQETPVLFIHCDENLPKPYAHFNEVEETPIAIALLLTSTGEEKLEFSIKPSADNEKPSNYAIDFLSFISGKSADMLSIGKKLQCQWKRKHQV